MAFRNILLIRLKPGTSVEAIDAFERELAAVPFPGRRNFTFGRDLGLREGNMDLAVSSDFEDEETFAAWVADPDHDRVRTQFLRPIQEHVERCFFRI